MTVTVAMFALVVDDYDRAIGFYHDALGLPLIEDHELAPGKRWVVLGGQYGARVLLAKAEGDRQHAVIGKQTGGRVGFFLETDDFASDHARLMDLGVQFLEAPRHETYGTVAVFEDPFGNSWDLIQPR